MRHDDTHEIRAALTARLEQVLDRYFPGWVYGKGKRSAFCAPRDARDLGSFEVILTGPRRGSWWRNSQGIGGDPINLIAYALGDHRRYREAFREAKSFLGVGLAADGQKAREAADARRADEARRRAESEAVDARQKESARDAAWRIWREATAAEVVPAYLGARGIDLALLAGIATLRGHPGLAHPDGGGRYRAVICAVQGRDDRFLGVWRIYTAPDGGKAPVAKPKLGLGPCSTGGVRLGPITETVHVAEGVETAFGVRGITGGKECVIAALSTSGMQNFVPPRVVRKVLIWPDGDRDKVRAGRKLESPGLKAAWALRDRLVAAGIPATVQPTPKSGRDYLDVYLRWKRAKDDGDDTTVQAENREAAA